MNRSQDKGYGLIPDTVATVIWIIAAFAFAGGLGVVFAILSLAFGVWVVG